MQEETNRLLQEMDSDIETCKPPFGFSFIKPLLLKAVQLLKLFNDRLIELEKGVADGE